VRESMVFKKRRILLLILAFVLVLNVLRLVGIIDFNLYSSRISSNQTASTANSKRTGNYRIEFEYDNNKIYTHAIMNNNEEVVPIIVKIEAYNFTGNYFMPFFKKFTTTYKCTFKTTNMNSDNVFTEENQISGKVEGSVVSEIKGICSTKKAKDLAIEKAFNSMKDYVVNSISKQE
jgi:flagellar basal body-associated protein FliL